MPRNHITHGEALQAGRTIEYWAWASMKRRCNNPHARGYPDYGGRGIQVCERWNRYENFLADMGRKPSPAHSLDRIDVDGNYQPSNCRWATKNQQASNTRKKNRTGFVGVSAHGPHWRAEIHINKKRIRVGGFISPELAAKYRKELECQLT